MRRTASRTDRMAMMTTVPALWSPGVVWSASAEGHEGTPQAGRAGHAGRKEIRSDLRRGAWNSLQINHPTPRLGAGYLPTAQW